MNDSTHTGWPTASRGSRAQDRWRRLALSLLVATLGSCGEAPSPTDAGSTDAGSPDGALLDAATDAGPSGLPVPTPSALPLGEGDVLRLGPGDFLDTASAFSVASDGGVTLVFESFDGAFTRGELWISTSRDGHAFTAAMPTGFTSHAFEASPSFVDGALYFAGADDLTSPPTQYLAQVGSAEALPAVAGVATLRSWPRLYRVEVDRVAVTFRDGSGRPSVAFGAEPSSLGAPLVVDDSEASARVALGVFGDGSLAVSYQRPDGAEPMVSFVRRSTDGVIFTEALRVTDMSDDVHDTTMVQRADGGLDLYYVYPETGSGRLALFRRALAADGTLGAEEQVTDEAGFEPTRPEGARLADGSLILAFADIASRSVTGTPTRQDLTLVRLTSDAP